MSEREKFIAAMQPMPCNYDDRTQKFTDAGVNLAWFAWQASRRAGLEEAIEIIETHKVPVGNSAAGEMAAGWTMDALHEVRDAIRALADGDKA